MNKVLMIVMVIGFFICSSCMHEYLDHKPDKKLVVPRSFDDYRAILDQGGIMNRQRTPFLGELSSDNYWVTDALLNSVLENHRESYLWKDFVPEADGNWNNPYLQIFYANVVLEGVKELMGDETGDITKLRQLKGEALFFRAWAYFQLSQLYCNPYNEKTVGTDLGLPLRLESDFNVKLKRSSLLDTYQQIISDAVKSAELMDEQFIIKTRPSRLAAYALLAKVYLQMNNYDEALIYANNVLEVYDIMIDYNTIDSEKPFPFAIFNEEVIWHCTMVASYLFSSRRLNVDTVLYRSYDENDLRKKMLYTIDEMGLIKYNGSYSESGNEFFAGIAVDELYLIRAECYARKGDVINGAIDLNKLMSKRINGDSFVNLEFENEIDLLDEIISERRKELVFRGIRWHDLRRLNIDPRFASTLERNYNGMVYKLLPNHKEYTLLIPGVEIELTGIKQNER